MCSNVRVRNLSPGRLIRPRWRRCRRSQHPHRPFFAIIDDVTPGLVSWTSLLQNLVAYRAPGDRQESRTAALATIRGCTTLDSGVTSLDILCIVCSFSLGLLTLPHKVLTNTFTVSERHPCQF